MSFYQHIFVQHASGAPVGEVPIKQFLRECVMHSSTDCYIPAYRYWPKPMQQFGACCGLYALAIALENFGLPHHARKLRTYNEPSLRQIAKELKVTTSGEIFNVMGFERICHRLGIHESSARCSDATYYIANIKSALHRGHLVITSCDTEHGALKNRSGLGAHWIVIFGYFYCENKLYFIVTQNNAYYAFPAEALLETNKQLPDVNPTKMMVKYQSRHPKAYKNEEYIVKPSYVRPVIEETLSGFRFAIFTLPNNNALERYVDFPYLLYFSYSDDQPPFPI